MSRKLILQGCFALVAAGLLVGAGASVVTPSAQAQTEARLKLNLECPMGFAKTTISSTSYKCTSPAVLCKNPHVLMSATANYDNGTKRFSYACQVPPK